MPNIYLEHANISVVDFDKALDFLKTAFPSFYIRGQAKPGENPWCHFGDEDTYIALSYSTIKTEVDRPNYSKAGFNHLGFVVDNVTDLSNRLTQKGYKKSYDDQNEAFRKRVYFLDTEGNEYEFVEYLSSKPEEKNAYEN